MEILQGLFKWLANKWILLFSFLAARHSLKPILVFSVGAIIGLVGIQFVPIQLDVQMRTKEKGILQYYVDTGSGFNEIQSKRIQLTESPDFSHYATFIPANGLRAIRIDPLETQGQLELLGLSIDYLVWHRQWHGQSELKSLVPNHEIEVDFISEGSLLFGQATGNDPSFVITDVGFFKNWQLMATIFSSVFGGVIALLLLVVIRHFGGIKTVLTNERAPLFIILIIAALLRIIYWGQSGLPSELSQLLLRAGSDERVYFGIAQYIMNHGFKDYFFAEKSVMAAPGNPVYLAMMYTVTNSVNVMRAINLLISILSIVLVYKLGKRIFNAPVGLLAAAICTLHVRLIESSPALLTEPLFLFFFIAGIYYLLLALDAQNLPRYRYLSYSLASASFLTIAILTRSIAMLLPVFLLVTMGALDTYHSWRQSKITFPLLKRVALPLILPLLIVGIIAGKNYVFFDRFMVATGAGASLYYGSKASTEGDEPAYRGQKYGGELVLTHGVSHLTIQGDKLLMEAAKKNIQETPLGYAWWSVKKVGRLLVGSNLAWFHPYKNFSSWYSASGRNALDIAKMVFQIILASSIAVYGIIGLVVTRGQKSVFIISVSTCYLIIFSIPFLVNLRYGLPLVMLLVIPASAVIYGAWHAPGRLRKTALFGVPFIMGIMLQIFYFG
jgi:4-amino-4-deoxy-L-arabinose transferase-like glycosyltransferase